MNFLYPGFLIALSAIVIPIIIHLFNFRKFKRIYFSNVAFLSAIKEQNSSREKIKNLLILIARILAIVFLVLAFARPYFVTNSGTSAVKRNVLSIYIDNSYSMNAVNKEGSLLDEAKRKAKEIVNSYQINDRFQLLTNDFEGRHQRLLNADEFVKALDDVKISATARKLQQILNRQESIFKGIDNRFAYIISDFQLSFSGNQQLKSQPTTRTTLVKLSANNLPNVAVDSVWFLSPVHQEKSNEQLVVQLKNFGEEDAKNVPVRLTINNQQKAISSMDVLAGKTLTDTLSFSGLSLGWQKATVGIKDFPHTFDDNLNISFNVNSNQKVLSVNGAKSGNYIKALFGADRYFKLTEMSEANINYAEISNYSLIVLNGLASPSSGLAQELNNYLKNGGTVVIFPDVEADKQIYTAFLTALNLPAVANLNTNPVKVSSIELKSSLFKGVFESLPDKIDLPQVNKYFSFVERNSNNQETLMHLPANNLFFSKFGSQSGLVYLCATDLNAVNGNLAQHPVFVPLMYKIAFSSINNQPIYYTVGNNEGIETSKIDLNTNQFLKVVANNFEIVPEVRQANGKSILYLADQVKKSGFYEVKNSDSLLGVVAFNDNRAESNMHYASKADLNQIIDGKQLSFIDASAESLKSAIASKNNENDLWKLCLILSLVFLAVEILLIKFYTLKKLQTYEPFS